MLALAAAIAVYNVGFQVNLMFSSIFRTLACISLTARSVASPRVLESNCLIALRARSSTWLTRAGRLSTAR